MIEDAPAGVEAAHAAGMAAVALVSTGRSRDELGVAVLVVASLQEISPDAVRAVIRQR